MSEFHDNIAAFVDDRASHTTDPVTILRTGKTISAEIEHIDDPLIIQSELGEDPREVCVLHVTADADIAAVNPKDLVRFRLFGALVEMKVVKRKNNPGSPQADFWCVKQTEQDS